MAGIDASPPRGEAVQETQFAAPEQVDAILTDGENVQLHSGGGSIVMVDNSISDGVHLSPPIAGGYGTIGLGTAPAPAPSSADPDPAPALRSPSPRVLAPDLLRGLIMLLQSIDHSNVVLGGWGHAQALTAADGHTVGGEKADTRVVQWNIRVGYACRTLTHLCAPGFMFLLGMGVVYFGRSRSKLGWSVLRMVRHFAVRGAVLILVNQVLSVLMLFKFFPILNIALLALGFNYFFAGLFWLAIAWTEARLARILARFVPATTKDPESYNLLNADSEQPGGQVVHHAMAASISFHVHNVFVLAVVLITMWWNIWLDPTRGHCVEHPVETAPYQRNPWFQFFFQGEFKNEYVLSAFPPLGWISPVLLGLLYGRLVTARPWKPTVVNMANLAASLVLMVLFVLTRLLHFGNLDESCLAMPEHLARPGTNQYLASIRSFFYVVKYPASPSLIFYSMGCNFFFLALFGLLPARFVRRFPFSMLLAYGTSALFFYAVHFQVYTLLAVVVKSVAAYKLGWEDFSGAPAYGVGPGPVYWISWAAGHLILWPLCRWYGRFKAGQDVDSIWRFF